MVPIYFCEDRPAVLAEITQIVERTIQINELDFRIHTATHSPVELLQSVTSEQGIYFLDVDLGQETMNGFELGKQIRELDPRGFIIYVTTHEELLSETFKYRVEALDYIYKDRPAEMREKIVACLSQIAGLLKKDQRDTRDFFTVTQGKQSLFVPLDDIIYFETSPKKHVVRLVGTERQVEFYGNLNEIVENLADRFLRVHRSFIVNLDHVQLCDRKNNTLHLSQGKQCFVARTKVRLVEQQMNK